MPYPRDSDSVNIFIITHYKGIKEKYENCAVCGCVIVSFKSKGAAHSIPFFIDVEDLIFCTTYLREKRCHSTLDVICNEQDKIWDVQGVGFLISPATTGTSRDPDSAETAQEGGDDSANAEPVAGQRRRRDDDTPWERSTRPRPTAVRTPAQLVDDSDDVVYYQPRRPRAQRRRPPTPPSIPADRSRNDDLEGYMDLERG